MTRSHTKLHNDKSEKATMQWKNSLPTLVLILLLVIFVSYTLFIAFNLQPGIIPDEKAHFVFSQHYATTWGIPPDVTDTYELGWYIQQNPFLYYWVLGRVINLTDLLVPDISDWQMLVVLRVLNAFFALCTVFFSYLLTKELIKDRWWRLLPVFLLTHTLMFVFLAGGVNYDNIANLFSMVAIFFLVRVLRHRPFISNSLGWMIFAFLGTLVKYPILPLALALSLAWIAYIIRNFKNIRPLKFNFKNHAVLSLLLLVIIAGNIGIYGYNLIAFRAITPSCLQLLSEPQCQLSPYYNRHVNLALDEKLSVQQAINMGFPDPITYTIDSWIPNMLYRIFGILGHLSYFPARIIILYRLLFYGVLLLAIRFWKKPNFTLVSLIGVISFYTLVLLITNYNSELVYGFRQIAVQGRYIFPVIGIAYVLLSKILYHLPHFSVKYAALIVTISLFIYGGPIKLLRYYHTIFSSWFIR
jgi:hypothetical protein